MNAIRDRLIARLDEILAEVVAQDLPSNASLQIEASLVLSDNAAGQHHHVVLDTINVDQLKLLTANPGTSATSPLNDQQDYRVHSFDSHSRKPAADLTTSSRLANATILAETTAGKRFKPRSSPEQLTTTSGPLAQPIPLTTASLTHVSAFVDAHVDQPLAPDRSKTQQPRVLQPAVDNLIEGIWDQIHYSKLPTSPHDLAKIVRWTSENIHTHHDVLSMTQADFSDATKRCHHITTTGRSARSVEVVIQAHWVDCFDARLATLKKGQPDLRPTDHKRLVMNEACTSFGWSEKELRNKMAAWKGYTQIKNASGWATLVFAGPGIYRFCKYRQGFDDESLSKLRSHRIRFEVAADTLQPRWREALALVGEPTQAVYTGHPHDWTVSLKQDEPALPLAVTYKQWDPEFSYQNLSQSTIDTTQWPDKDPRRFESAPPYHCKSCTQFQSTDLTTNLCACFPTLYSPQPLPSSPVQVFRTGTGKNNGLLACAPFPPNRAIGEFIGRITKNLADVDVMQSQAGDDPPYQIWQGRCGNFTRFINHSCASNCAFQTFSWLGVQRIVVVSSKEIKVGEELTVDYSDRYWQNLDKVCLCGEEGCRFKDRRRMG
ncbi:hypothetical protein LTR64_000329 [Lithohypha guttulata]|uniref:uncharacterized protein n=1 Tax=Lithohypha guttulata TaxID=1690604 RepID=UPI002DE1D2A7|nr:hypothetical protein LTR51_005901 [Lithohypha guttulata]